MDTQDEIKGTLCREVSRQVVSVSDMDCRGLVDPNNKPFGRVLPLEVQVKIMFWVHCFHTMDKRKKVVQEFKRLPKCDLSGYPKVLGDYYTWNQVVTRLNTRRSISCHHCHRLIEQRLSVSKKRCVESSSSSHDLDIDIFFFWVFQIGMMAEMARQPPISTA